MTKTANDVLQELASGWTLRWDENELNAVPPGGHPVAPEVLNELIDAHYVKGFANGGGFWISDDGLKAYLRSTDELVKP